MKPVWTSAKHQTGMGTPGESGGHTLPWLELTVVQVYHRDFQRSRACRAQLSRTELDWTGPADLGSMAAGLSAAAVWGHRAKTGNNKNTT